ncbi:MAG: hypothetical protein JXA04_00760 [Gammaproteobacteria bacterium]|nr:hypothetical protein [Gammaproteobacteria bacterium]
MKCNELNNLIDDYIAGQIEAGVEKQISDHLTVCIDCRERVRQYKEYFVRMATFNAPNLDSGRSARILRLAVEEGEKRIAAKKHKLSFMRGFAAASILAVALLFGVNTLNTSNPPSEIVSMYDWERDISLVIHVPNDMDGALLVLDLPDDISIRGLEYLAHIEWPVDLKKGSNVITLPINIEPYAEYAEQLTLAASIEYKDKKRDFMLDISLASPQTGKHSQLFDASAALFNNV